MRILDTGPRFVNSGPALQIGRPALASIEAAATRGGPSYGPTRIAKGSSGRRQAGRPAGPGLVW